MIYQTSYTNGPGPFMKDGFIMDDLSFQFISS